MPTTAQEKGYLMGNYSEKHKIKAMFWAVVIPIATIICIVLVNDTRILQSTYDKTKPFDGDSIYTDLVLSYREASREAVEDYFGKSVTDDYIYCYTAPMGGGMFYYCIVDGAAYYFWVDAGSSEDVYSHIVYNTRTDLIPEADEFDFVLQEGWIGGPLFASIKDA